VARAQCGHRKVYMPIHSWRDDWPLEPFDKAENLQVFSSYYCRDCIEKGTSKYSIGEIKITEQGMLAWKTYLLFWDNCIQSILSVFEIKTTHYKKVLFALEFLFDASTQLIVEKKLGILKNY